MAKKQKKQDSKSAFTYIPESVRKQAEKADALLTGDNNPDDLITDVIVDDPKATNPEPATADPVKPAEPTPAPTPAPAPVQTPAAPEANWEHKYNVLQGMFNKQDQEMKALTDTINNLQAVINQQSAALLERQAQPAPVLNTPPAGSVQKIEKNSLAAYGDEIVYLAEGYNQLVDLVSSLQAQLSNRGAANGPDNSRLDRIERIVEETAQERFTRELGQSIPRWREVMNTPEFRGWLQNIDDTSGYQYRTMMDYAMKNLRSSQAAAIIRRFSLDTGIQVGASQQPAQPKSVINDQTLEGQVMPDAAASVNQGQPKVDYPTAEDVKRASELYTHKKISIEVFNDISNRYQMGLAAAKRQNS